MDSLSFQLPTTTPPMNQRQSRQVGATREDGSGGRTRGASKDSWAQALTCPVTSAL